MDRLTCWAMLGLRGELLLLWISTAVPASLLQPPPAPPAPPPPSLSLPVNMVAVPSTWHFLPLTHDELGSLFSNSSPFLFSQSVFMLPPPGWSPPPTLQASFGPHSVSKLLPDSAPPSSSLLSASLLSEGVEVDGDGEERFRVRVLFHQRGDLSRRRTCIFLHAFQETEERRSSCLPQPPLGLCVVSLNLPSTWFKDQHSPTSHRNLSLRSRDPQLRGRVRRRGRHHHGNHRQPALPHWDPGDVDRKVPKNSQIQLYYSYSDPEVHGGTPSTECVQDRVAPSQKKLFYLRAVGAQRDPQPSAAPWEEGRREPEPCLEEQDVEELHLDAIVLVRYHRGPVLIGRPLRVSVSLRANITAQLGVIRLSVQKGLVSVVAQRTVSSGLWSVTLEKSEGSERDGLSIYFHRYSAHTPRSDPAPWQQIVCLSVLGLRTSFGVAMTVPAEWGVEYSGSRSSRSARGAAVSLFSFADRRFFGLAAITETDTIINTAVLDNRPVSLPVIVLAVGLHGGISDVTSAVTCHSTDRDTIKVSRDCSVLFVDGSESGVGSTCVAVTFDLGSLSSSVCVSVWVPSVPLRLSLSDPVLNAIQDLDLLTEEGCVPVYQRSSVQVLAQFTARDPGRGPVHLLGSPDWFVDVTGLVGDWLRVEDPQIVTLDPQNVLIGLRPGRTSIHLISEQWDGLLGHCDITVTSDPVSLGDLSVQVVSGLDMSITASPAHASIVTSTVLAYNVLYSHHQEASISVWLQFSDDTASLLSTFDDLPLSLHLSSLAQSVVAVAPGPGRRLLARGDGGGPLVRAELMASTCAAQQITLNALRDDSLVFVANEQEVEGAVRVVARGSGWVRVYLDLPFLQPEDGSEDFDVSDMLIEGDADGYTSNKDENVSRADSGWEVVVHEDTVYRNTLERAVVMPSLGEGSIYFSSHDTVEDRSESEASQRRHELQVGICAVLALVALFCVLFLANCLPCALGGAGGSEKDYGEGRLPRRSSTEEGEVNQGEGSC